MVAASALLGGLVYMLVIGLWGAAVGVVMTALTSAVMTPTRWSLALNVALGGIGYDLGLVWCYRSGYLSGGYVRACAFAAAVFATLMHELMRWVGRQS